ARAELSRRRAELDFATGARDRAHRLYALKSASLEQVQRAEADVKTAEQSITAAQAEINRTVEHLDHLGLSAPSAEAEYAKAGGAGKYEEDELVPVKAPLTGTILKRLVSPGTVVTPASDIFVVSDLSSLWATAEVPERFLALVRVGQKVAITVQAYPGRVFRATVAQIGDVLSPDTRTVQVRCQLRNPDRLLKPEMYATIVFEFGATDEAVLIPVAALQEVGGESVVFVREGEARFRMRSVRTGRQAGDRVEALEGVRSGEPVVTAGSFLLKSELLKRQMAGE
ncbi:MAG: efflux RND transporter periplasmic adaptor subunit, partial [Alphaproteobacteria bacterium]|nr:efflux RND transporter periplasmic adaptor subunit [Alphaproteobacteria bacterium]